MMMSESRRKIYRALDNAAAYGMSCPTNLQLSHEIGCRSVATPSWHIKKLEESGLIHVTRGSRSRIVEIVSTKRKTGGANAPEYSQKPRAKKARQMPQDDIARLVRHDDSCFKCGTARGCNCGVAL